MKNTEESNNNSKNSLVRLRIIIQSIAIGSGLITGLIITYIFNKEALQNNLFWLSTIVWVLIVVTIVLSSIYGSTNNKEVDEYYNAAKNAINKNTTDINELMLLNMKEIKDYYVLSKKMAQGSFILSIIMSAVGFTLLCISIVPVFKKDISLSQTLLPVIGGTIVELIAGTTLVIHKKSLEQLNHYYKSLHNNERYLSLISLIDKLSKERKDEAYISIINSQLETLKEFQ
ncbi:MAG: hypothetical protein HDR09_08230 [Lachnospiraceae bacterium]|nr:hypothetical protein [Lachnospiraceae bacterium]